MTSVSNVASGAADARAAASDSTALRDRVWFQRMVVWGGILIAWEVFAWRAGSFFFPSLAEVARGFGEMIREGDLITVLTSYRQMLAGFLLAVVVGVPLGILIGVSSIAQAAFGWIVDALFVTSLVALLPFIILLTGTDFAFRVSVVFLFASFYMIMTPAAGVRSVDRDLLEMARSFHASSWKSVRSITAPSVFPYILAGARLGMGQAIQGMVVAELWITLGTGRRLQSLGLARQLGEFFALAATVVIFGIILTQGLQLLQRRLTPWADDIEGAVSR